MEVDVPAIDKEEVEGGDSQVTNVLVIKNENENEVMAINVGDVIFHKVIEIPIVSKLDELHVVQGDLVNVVLQVYNLNDTIETLDAILVTNEIVVMGDDLSLKG